MSSRESVHLNTLIEHCAVIEHLLQAFANVKQLIVYRSFVQAKYQLVLIGKVRLKSVVRFLTCVILKGIFLKNVCISQFCCLGLSVYRHVR